jgi:hypothetical protein
MIPHSWFEQLSINIFQGKQKVAFDHKEDDIVKKVFFPNAIEIDLFFCISCFKMGQVQHIIEINRRRCAVLST